MVISMKYFLMLILSSNLIACSSFSKKENLSFNKESVRQTVKSEKQKFIECYEQALKAKPNLQGKLVMAWSILPTGSTSNVRVIQSLDKELDDCFTEVFNKMTFTKPPNGLITEVTAYPFVLNSKKDINPEENN